MDYNNCYFLYMLYCRYIFFMIGWWWGTRWSRAYRNKRKKGKYLIAIKIFHILRQRGVLWNKIFKNGPSIIIWRLSLKNWYVMVFLEAVFHNLCLLHFTILWHFWSYLPTMLHFSESLLLLLFFFFFLLLLFPENAAATYDKIEICL